MSLRCSICDLRCRNRTELADHEREHESRYFRAKFVKGGPFIGVRLFVGPPIIDGEGQDRSPRLQVMVADETTSRAVLMLGENDIPVEIEGVTLRSVEPVLATEWQFLIAHQTWATENAPSHPKASPRKPVDFNSLLPF